MLGLRSLKRHIKQPSPFWTFVVTFAVVYLYHRQHKRRTLMREQREALGIGEDPVFTKLRNTDEYDKNYMDLVLQQWVPGYPVNFSLKVTNDMIDNFEVQLPPLLKEYKNPCWIEEVPTDFSYTDSFFNKCKLSRKFHRSKYASKFNAYEQYLHNRTRKGEFWRIRCFPSFFVLGVGKCGTTDLFDIMSRYLVDIVPGFLKEVQYWNWKRCISSDRDLCHGNKAARPGLSDYLDTYDAAAEVIRRAVVYRNGTEYHPLITGDFTPSTLTFHPCWAEQPGNRHLDGPRFSTQDYIRHIRPQTKFIVLLRDPVDRVYSNYMMKDRNTGKNMLTPRKFHDEITTSLSEMTVCFHEATARSCAYKYTKFNLMTHITNSMYELYISDWLAVFPKEQFLFIRTEDYQTSRAQKIKDIASFLDLAPVTKATEQEISNTGISNQAPKKTTMLDETRKLLQDFYRPWNIRLAKLLGDDHYRWGY